MSAFSLLKEVVTNRGLSGDHRVLDRSRTHLYNVKAHDSAISAFDDIPGTTLFDAQRSRQGYHLNMFCMSLAKPENRAAFRADERAYLEPLGLSAEQEEAVLKRDWNRMLELGGNIYYTSKLGATDGLSFQQLAAKMTGTTQQEYAQMMLDGGRSIEGNRSKLEAQRG